MSATDESNIELARLILAAIGEDLAKTVREMAVDAPTAEPINRRRRPDAADHTTG